MCRLLGYATRVPTTLAALLGEDDLNGFTELSVKHGDGWGRGWTSLGNGQMLVVQRGTLATAVRPLDPVYARA